MSIFGKYFSGGSNSGETLLESPYCLQLRKEDFIKIKTENLYKRILERVYSRTEGAKDDDKIKSLFDSVEKSDNPEGLITLISRAMQDKAEIAIIYESGIVRIATFDEKKKIKESYSKNVNIKTDGIVLNFTNYKLTDLVQSYMSMTYDILTSMNTQVGLAKALQIKINNLRSTVSAVGKDQPIEQAKEINESLTKGRSVLMDKQDEVSTLKLDSASVGSALTLVNSQLASDLGVSLSFINGELTTGMSATGEADANADEYGFQDFFNSIFKPACEKLYEWKLIFITDDWRYSGAMIDKLIIVENSGILTPEQKLAYAERTIPVRKK